jgi:hypothetical protein
MAEPIDDNAEDLKWLETVYQKDVRQLTVRAVISGMLIGMLLCISNLYRVERWRHAHGQHFGLGVFFGHPQIGPHQDSIWKT